MNLPSGWSKENEKLLLIFKCRDFNHAMALLNTIGDIAEKQGHHPDFGVRNYNELFVSTTTHDINKITEKDYKLAQEITDLISHEEKA